MPADAGSHGETPGRAAWDALAASALNGGDIKSLESASADGVPLGPIFERVTVDRPRAWRAAMRWETCERIDEPDPARASDDLRAAAAGGADAVEIVLVGAPRAYGLGVSLDSATDARTTIAAVDAARGPAIALSTGEDFVRDAAPLVAAVSRDLPPSVARVAFGLDPFNFADADGGAARLVAQARFARRLADEGWRGPYFVADSAPAHEAGASEAQEIAFALAAVVEIARAAEEAGLSRPRSFEATAVHLAADADVVLGVAKFRAVRLCAARIAELSDVSAAAFRIEAQASRRMAAKADPHANLLRVALAIAAAALGGADRVTPLPFTQAPGDPDAFARRVARNASIVLRDECFLARVADPAAGAGAFEAATLGLCEAAWAEFRAIEGEGGLGASLASGAFAGRVAAKASARAARFAPGGAKIVGVNAWPGAAPAAVATRGPAGRAAPRRFPDLRDAAPFETEAAR